jgi:hypothetical protein
MRQLSEAEMKELVDKLFPHAQNVEGNEFYHDGYLTVGQILTAADWIRYRTDEKPFSMKWLQENIDEAAIDRSGKVCIYFEDVISDERGEAGHLDIVYLSQLYWTVGKGTAGTEWLCTCSNSWRNDDWIPSIQTIGDFKRLWRVATGFDLPLKNAKDNS